MRFFVLPLLIICAFVCGFLLKAARSRPNACLTLFCLFPCSLGLDTLNDCVGCLGVALLIVFTLPCFWMRFKPPVFARGGVFLVFEWWMWLSSY